MKRAFIAATALGALAGTPDLRAQQNDPCIASIRSTGAAALSGDVTRLLDVSSTASTHSFLLRRSGAALHVPLCDAAPALRRVAEWYSADEVGPYSVRPHPVDVMLTQHSTYPRDWNDGVLWSGVGLSMSATGGVELRWGRFEASFAPILVLEQNDGFVFEQFPDSSVSPYLHRWHGRFIDLPQRQGRETRMFLDAGHSHVTARAAGMRIGISSQNIMWGPARRNALLLSGTAPGFMHAFLETDGLRRAGPVDAEAQLFLGRLEESDFYDFDARNDQRALFGAAFSLRPRGADGLYLGAGYLHMQEWNDATSMSDLFVAPVTGLDADSAGLSRELRLFSLFLRWAAPGGLEIYGEWARQDSWEEWIRLLNPFDVPQAYTVGLQKVVRRGDNALRFSAEFSHLADPIDHRSLGRGVTTFYVSPYVRQGHTHRGQLLGAPIGPGSEAQFLGVDLFTRIGRSSFSIERARYDDDAYHAVWGVHHAVHGHDTELSFRAGHAFATGRLVFDTELGYSRRFSRSFLGLSHVNYPGYPYRAETNFGMRLEGRWNPPLPTRRLR